MYTFQEVKKQTWIFPSKELAIKGSWHLMGYALIIWKFNDIDSSRILTKNTICNLLLSVKIGKKGRRNLWQVKQSQKTKINIWLYLPNKVKEKIFSLEVFSCKGNIQKLELTLMYWMRHLASLYLPYEKLFKSIYTAVKTVFKIRLIQNIQKKKFSHKEAMWLKVHYISSVTLSFIYILYVV